VIRPQDSQPRLRDGGMPREHGETASRSQRPNRLRSPATRSPVRGRTVGSSGLRSGVRRRRQPASGGHNPRRSCELVGAGNSGEARGVAIRKPRTPGGAFCRVTRGRPSPAPCQDPGPDRGVGPNAIEDSPQPRGPTLRAVRGRLASLVRRRSDREALITLRPGWTQPTAER